MRRFCLNIFMLFVGLLFMADYCSAANLKGKIFDEQNGGVPFVAIYIDGTTQGTTSNIDGEYSFQLSPGTYKIMYQLIGYTIHSETVVIGSTDIVRDVHLKQEGISMQAVTINSNSEDPGVRIIKHAIAMRKHYLDQVQAYSCDAYIKGIQRIKKHPKKILGRELNFNRMDSNSGIIYLSESVSKFNFMQPGKIKEEMISSKVSGNSQAFSYNQESEMLINFYENNVNIDDVSERGFVSPIANDALFYYTYKLAGTFADSGRIVDKIEVLPKRKNDPVFRGYIYILEDGWRIYSTDLYLSKDAQIQFVDTLYINQVFLPVEPDTWMVFSDKVKFNFSFLGIVGEGVFIAMNSNYNIHPDFPPKFFNGEVMKVDSGSNKKDTSYWNKIRPVPLTHEEVHDYHKRDSMQKIYDSKPYMDSLDRRRNKFHWQDIFIGYNHFDHYDKETWRIYPLIESVSFNTVQGWCAGLKMAYAKQYGDKKYFLVNGSGGYGFSSMQPYGNITLTYYYNLIKRSSFSLGGGVDDVQFNGQNPISPFINSLYTLFQDENYMKLYHRSRAFASHQNEIMNGVTLMESVDYSDRMPLMNTTNYKLVNFPSRQYTSNDPLNPANNSSEPFTQSQSLSGLLELKIHLKQQYMSMPDRKFIFDSKYPVLTIDYRKAAGIFSTNDANYDYLKCSLIGQIGLKLFGTSQYSISAGKFLTSQQVQFMDYTHFSGNQTIFSSFQITDFQLLDYYKYSTAGPFMEVHYEHNFQGFILNKFPLLRKLKLDEIVGVNFLTTNNLPEYYEVFAGISKLDAVRVEVVGSYSQQQGYMRGIRIGLSL